MKPLAAFSLMDWVEAHRDQLRPPVVNATLFDDGDFIVMVVGGPNLRTDYHDDPHDELFYQLRGSLVMRLMEARAPREIQVAAGGMFLVPAHVRHSPQRPDPDGVGLVIERRRAAGAFDGFEWFCPNCHLLLHRIEIALHDIVADLPPLFDTFYQDQAARTCKRCGAIHPAPPGDLATA